MSKSFLDRRTFLKGSAATSLALACSTFSESAIPSIGASDNLPEALALVYIPEANNSSGASSKSHRLDLLDLNSEKILTSFCGLQATHAITPIESKNLFVVHGVKVEKNEGSLLVIQVDPHKKNWKVLLDQEIPGGTPLHWQPNPDHSEILFNTTGDGRLHVLDIDSLKVSSFPGGGSHSNMAFLRDYLVATDKWKGTTTLNVIHRKKGEVVSSTPVGSGGHGLTVNLETSSAWVWSWDGVHRVSLDKKTMGRHLGVLKAHRKERSWFCWTPQGGRYSHDVSWSPDDKYASYLSVLDMKNHRLEKIETQGGQPSYLQVSPDGRYGLSSLHGKNSVAHFDLVGQRWLGNISVGEASSSFFERDMAFFKDRRYAAVTNTQEKSLSLIDLKEKREVKKIPLQGSPSWMKVIS